MLIQMDNKYCVFIIGLWCILVGVAISDTQDEPHPCERPCFIGQQPMICEYNFTIEWYLTLSKACYGCPFNLTDCYRPHCISGDGQRRKIITINRKHPGPKIEVCENDTIIVNVKNKMANGEGVIMHWHGMTMRGTNHMDGGARVTQCPIPQHNQFKYEFVAYPSGSYIYHSHSGMQRADGLIGALIVQEPARLNAHYDLYDHNCNTTTGECEKILFISEWQEPDYLWAEMKSIHEQREGNVGRLTTLINGKMQYYNATNALYPGKTALTPMEVFNVVKGNRYRFRLIGLSVECNYQVSIDDHKLLTISADGYDVEPLEVDIISFMPGERYDFIWNANQPVGNYWLKVQSLHCGAGYAIVHYQGAHNGYPDRDKTLNGNGIILNPVNVEDTDGLINAVELNSTHNEDFTAEEVDEVHYIAMKSSFNDRSQGHHPIYYPVDEVDPMFRFDVPVLNNISHAEPKSPLVTQFDDVDPSTFCNSSTINHEACEAERCFCTHVERITLGSVVDLVFINIGGKTGMAHPVHLHGYHFRIMAQAKISNVTTVHEIQHMYETGLIPLKLHSPSYRDTIQVPEGGFVIARFIADNPGWWLLHCHIDPHAETGQQMVFQVGDREQMTPPPSDLPKCGDWMPSTSAASNNHRNEALQTPDIIRNGASKTLDILKEEASNTPQISTGKKKGWRQLKRV